METQLQNVTTHPLYLESIGFIPSPQFEVQNFAVFDASRFELSDKSKAGGADASKSGDGGPNFRTAGLPPYGSMAYLKSGSTQQHMFRLRDKYFSTSQKSAVILGRVELRWQGSMGESGHLSSSAVQRKLVPLSPIEVDLKGAPDSVRPDERFELVYQVKNMSEKIRRLYLSYSPPPNACVALDGISGQRLGPIKQYETCHLSFTMIAFSTGIHGVVGLQLVDSVSGESFDIGSTTCILCLDAPMSTLK